MNNISVFTNLTEGQQVKFARLAKGYRQVDLASIAKVNVGDVTAIEKDRFLKNTRREKILAALGLLSSEADHE